jgi:hypothetical protein
MAGFTRHPTVVMGRVTKEDVVSHLHDLFPWNGFLSLPVSKNFLDFLAFSRYYPVTTYASFN